jgi:hypothetical protein
VAREHGASFRLEVDGGIKAATIAETVRAGRRHLRRRLGGVQPAGPRRTVRELLGHGRGRAGTRGLTDGGPTRVLVVDDDEDIRAYLEVTLELATSRCCRPPTGRGAEIARSSSRTSSSSTS